MQKTVKLLAALLAVQLVLAVSMSFSAPDLAAARPNTPLLNLGGHTPDRLEIDGPDQQHLLLAKHDKLWVLPDTENFPADQSKVEHLISLLQGLRRGFAVATTAGAQKRFKVSDTHYERKLVLAGDGSTLATLYLGTSPGVRRVHARTAKDDAVYTTQLGTYDVPLSAENWEDKALLHLPAADIEQIDLAGLDLSRLPSSASTANKTGAPGADRPWTAKGLPDGEALNQAHTADLVQEVATLNFASVLGSKALPGYALQAPQLTFKVERKNGSTLSYRLGRRGQEKDYVLKVSNRPEYFRLTGASGDALIKAAGRDQLVSARAAPDKTPSTQPASSAGAGHPPQARAHGNS